MSLQAIFESKQVVMDDQTQHRLIMIKRICHSIQLMVCNLPFHTTYGV